LLLGDNDMSMKIWFVNDDYFGEGQITLLFAKGPDKIANWFSGPNRTNYFQHVATVTSNQKLEHIYAATQSINVLWKLTAPEWLVPLDKLPLRSMSMGDIIEEDGVFHIVDVVGFTYFSNG
jgi:hypothetical protein